MRQNVFLFEEIAICTFFGAIWYKTECVLPLNGVRFGAKWRAFWCKMQGKMVQNTRRKA